MTQSNQSNVPAVNRQTSIHGMIKRYQGRAENLLPATTSYKKLVSMFMTAIEGNPKLMACTNDSLLISFLKCAITGLEPNTSAQECFIIPYANSANWQSGFSGVMKLARNTGNVSGIIPRVVHQKDHFVHHEGTAQTIEHIPYYGSGDEDLGPIVAAYCIWKFNDGSPDYNHVIRPVDWERAKKASKPVQKNGVKGTPWESELTGLAEKIKIVAIRLSSKYIPYAWTDERLQEAALDDAVEGGKAENIIDIEAEVIEDDDKKTKSERLAEDLPGDDKSSDKTEETEPATTTGGEKKEPEEKVDPEITDRCNTLQVAMEGNINNLSRKLQSEAQEMLDKTGVTVEELKAMTKIVSNAKKK